MKWPASALIVGTVATAIAPSPVMFRADARHGGIYDAAGVAGLHGVKWTFRTGGAVISTPAVADGRVYFGSFDSNVYALDASSGALVGKFTTAGERRFSARHLHGAEPAAEVMPDPFDVFLSSPVVIAGVVSAAATATCTRSMNPVARCAGSSTPVTWIHASPAVADGTLYIGSWDSYFYALDAASGRQRWRFKTGEDPNINNQVGIQSSAVVADGVVYFGCRDSHLYALDAASGAKRWAFSTADS